MRLVAGRGMVSDDTEHAVMTARALARSGGHVATLGAALARQLRRWLLMLPAAVGLATLRACLKLCVGFGPARSGVFSAGNGPLMRAPVIGAALESLSELRAAVERSTRITHTDPKAVRAATVVALAAWVQRRSVEADGAEQLAARLRAVAALELAEDDDLQARVARAVESAARGESTAEFAAREGQGRGVSGYCHDTAPACLHAWLRHPRDVVDAVTEVIAAGGDADTTAAITGGIVGASGATTRALDALSRVVEWPWSAATLERVASAAAEAIVAGEPRDPGPVWVAARLIRNVCFVGIVLAHGMRRLFPPY